MFSDHTAPSLASRRRHAGAILLSSLLLLIIMTVLALGASRVTRIQAGGVNSIQQRLLALQAAETALSAGERIVNEPMFEPSAKACSHGRCRVYAPGTIDLTAARRSVQWWREHGWRHTPERSANATAGELWYVLEELATQHASDSPTATAGLAPELAYYRITAASLRDGRIGAILQSVIARGSAQQADDPSPGHASIRAACRQSWRQLY